MIVKARQKGRCHKQVRFVSFSNAFYQGEYDTKQKKVGGEGLMYFPNHHLIISTLFDHLTVSKKSLFYHNNNKFAFGTWNQNRPNGILQVKLDQALIVAQYKNGNLSEGSKLIIFLENYNLGVTMQIVQDQWIVVEKQEIYCKQQFQNLLRKYGFKGNEIQFSMVRILNDLITYSPSRFGKLKLIEEKYYQYGYQNGLKVKFDEKERLIHIKFNQHIQFNIPENHKERQLSSTQIQCLLKKQSKIDSLQPGHIYRRSSVGDIFINESFIDPSEEYFQYFQNLIDENCIKKLTSGFIKKSISPNKNYSNSKYADMINQMLVSSANKQEKNLLLSKKQKEKDITKQINDQIQNSSNISQFQLLQKKKDCSYSFEELPQKYKLNIMKKQQQQIINHKFQREGRDSINVFYRNTQPKNLNLLYFDTSPIDQLSIIKHQYPRQMVNKQTNTDEINVQNIKDTSPNRKTRTRQKIFQESPFKKNNSNHTQSLFVYSDFLSPKQQQHNYSNNQKERSKKHSSKNQQLFSEVKGKNNESNAPQQKTKSRHQISKFVVPNESLFQSKQIEGSIENMVKNRPIDVNMSPLKNKNYFLQKPETGSRNTVSYNASYKKSNLTPEKTILNSSSPSKKQRIFKYFKEGESDQKHIFDYLQE